jgi:hypothetical protein
VHIWVHPFKEVNSNHLIWMSTALLKEPQYLVRNKSHTAPSFRRITRRW